MIIKKEDKKINCVNVIKELTLLYFAPLYVAFIEYKFLFRLNIDLSYF